MSSTVKQISATLRSKQKFHLFIMYQRIAGANFQRLISTDKETNTGKTVDNDSGLCFVPMEI